MYLLNKAHPEWSTKTENILYIEQWMSSLIMKSKLRKQNMRCDWSSTIESFIAEFWKDGERDRPAISFTMVTRASVCNTEISRINPIPFNLCYNNN